MALTDRKSLWGYNLADVERAISTLQEEHDRSRRKIELELKDLTQDIEDLRQSVDHMRLSKTQARKRVVERPKKMTVSHSLEGHMSKKLYEAHIESAQKIFQIQQRVDQMIEEKKALITIQKQKIIEMRQDVERVMGHLENASPRTF